MKTEDKKRGFKAVTLNPLDSQRTRLDESRECEQVLSPISAPCKRNAKKESVR